MSIQNDCEHPNKYRLYSWWERFELDKYPLYFCPTCECYCRDFSNGETSVCEGSGTLGANKDTSVADSTPLLKEGL